MLRIIATIGAIQGLTILVNLIRSKIVAVLLGPEGVGILSLVDQLVQLVAYVSAFSLPFAAIKFLSRSHSQGLEAFEQSYATFLRMLLLLTTGGAAIGLAVVLWRPELLGPELSAYRAFLLPALIGVPAMALHGFFGHVLAAAQHARAAAVMALVIAIALAIAAYVGISVGGIAGLYWGSLLAGILIAIGACSYLRRRLGLPLLAGSGGIRRELREHPDIVAFALILGTTTVTLSLSYLAMRYAVLTSDGEAGAGLLQAAIALSGALGLVLGPANGLYLTPILNRDIAAGEKLRAALEFQARLMVVIGALAMPIVLFPEWMLIVLFSPAFVEVSRVVFLFVAGQCILQLAGVYQALIIGLDDLRMYGIIVVLSHLALGALSWLLAPQYGIAGVAIGFLGSSVLLFVLTLARLAARHRFALPARLYWSIGYGLLAVLLVGGLATFHDAWQPLVVLGKLSLYAVFVAGLLLFLPRDELRQLSRLGESAVAGDDRAGQDRPVSRAYRWVAGQLFPER